MQTLLEDIQFSIRSFIKTPMVCVLIVMTLALGIGANTAIFSMVYNVLIAPLPFADGDRLIKIETNNPKVDRKGLKVSVPIMEDYRNQNTHLSHLVEYHQMSFTLQGYGSPKSLAVGTVSWNYFELFKIKPILGRTFLPGEDQPGARALIVLSYRYWRETFGGSPDVIGMNLQVNNKIHQVIGVLPPLAAYPDKNDIWVASSSCPMRSSENTINNRERNFLALYGKLKADSSIESASLELNSISKRLMSFYPDSYPSQLGLSNTLVPLKTAMAGQSGPTFYLLMSITALVLLIACANVANLNLARTASRQQEFAIREAMGACPRRIARQVLTESVILSLTGGLLGLVIAVASNDLLTRLVAHYTSLSTEVEINSAVLGFCLLVSLIIGIVSGASAAFQRRHINESLKEGSGNITASGTSNRIRQALLVLQFSLAFIVVTSAMLVSLSLYRLNNQYTGFNSSDVIALQMGPGMSSASLDQWHRFAEEASEKLELKPGIDQVAYATTFPMIEGRQQLSLFQIEGRPPKDSSQRKGALRVVVSENYHRVLAIPLRQGRYFAKTDGENETGGVIVNQAFVDSFFADENPIDKRISLDQGKTWLAVHGVVADTREMGVDIPPEPTCYTLLNQYPRWSWLKLLIRTEEPLSNVSNSILETIHDINPEQAVANLTTLTLLKEESLASADLVGRLVALFASLAFAIALCGVVGIVAYNVNLKRKEIGIRVALGANPKRIRAHFLVQGLSLCALGICIGIVVMALVSPVMASVLFETSTFDSLVYFGTGLVVALAALIAILAPVQKAMTIEPSSALKEQ